MQFGQPCFRAAPETEGLSLRSVSSQHLDFCAFQRQQIARIDPKEPTFRGWHANPVTGPPPQDQLVNLTDHGSASAGLTR